MLVRGGVSTHVLLHHGREYDAAAIAGIAHGLATGRTLTAADIPGGSAAASKALIRLGFDIRDDSRPSPSACPAPGRRRPARPARPQPRRRRPGRRVARASRPATGVDKLCPTLLHRAARDRHLRPVRLSLRRAQPQPGPSSGRPNQLSMSDDEIEMPRGTTSSPDRAAAASSARVHHRASSISAPSTSISVLSGTTGEAEHQARRQRPGLAAEVGHLAHPDADLLVDLAAYGVLERLPRLAEAGERGPAARAATRGCGRAGSPRRRRRRG